MSSTSAVKHMWVVQRTDGDGGDAASGQTTFPVYICVLGAFRVYKAGLPVSLRNGGKAEALLCALAQQHAQGIAREQLLEILWPDGSLTLAGQSLNSLVYSLHRLLGDEIGGASPVLHTDGYYQLNRDAGVGVDLASFESLVSAADQLTRDGRDHAAAVLHTQAVRLYGGDLQGGTDLQNTIERERLRTVYLGTLSRLADYYYSEGDYASCLQHAQQLLLKDPCREDAHRLVMRCHVRKGERAQALRQYRTCEHILRHEFDAAPEPATTALFDQIRLYPDSI
jgi:DNA-binding SARP family transcriptional activator